MPFSLLLKDARSGFWAWVCPGCAMANYLTSRGAEVLGVDQNESLNCDPLHSHGLKLLLGHVERDVFSDCEALLVSPGVDPRQPAVEEAQSRGLPVFGELELVGPLPCATVAVTGTNGKSTVAALVDHMLRAIGCETFLGGNFGEPISAWIDRGGKADVAILELSSFQLETAYRFAPEVGVVLNVTPDHGDRYPDIETYAAAKGRVVENLGPNASAVLNMGDARVAAMAKTTKSRVLGFGRREDREAISDGAVVENETLCGLGSCVRFTGWSASHPVLMGTHNQQNLLAALLAIFALGKDENEQQKAYDAYFSFHGLTHRLEEVAEIAGVRWINDSKATNDDAAAWALRAMQQPVILLAGGFDKGGGYDSLARAACRHARIVFAFGQAGTAIEYSLKGHPTVVSCAGMREAMERARDASQPGDVVLLAPACSSFDEFSNYRERGEAFRDFVKALQREEMR